MSKKAKTASMKVADAAASTAPVVTTAAQPAQVPQEERNGVTRPRAGGKCAAVWDAMQALYEKNGATPTNKDATDWATATGANVSNAQQEVARFRKFMGISRLTVSASRQ